MLKSVESIGIIRELFSKHCEDVTVMYNEANCYTVTFKPSEEPFFINIAKSVFFNLRDLYGIVSLTIIKSLGNFNGNSEYNAVLTAVLQDITDAVIKDSEEEQAEIEAQVIEDPVIVEPLIPEQEPIVE